jgi:hypothetical protein
MSKTRPPIVFILESNDLHLWLHYCHLLVGFLKGGQLWLVSCKWVPDLLIIDRDLLGVTLSISITINIFLIFING